MIEEDYYDYYYGCYDYDYDYYYDYYYYDYYDYGDYYYYVVAVAVLYCSPLMLNRVCVPGYVLS